MPRPLSIRLALLAGLLGVGLTTPQAFTQVARILNDIKPAPDLRDVKYGPHERNVLDFWKAKADGPTPVVVFFHGGGFRTGSKSSLDGPLLNDCLRAGISVATVNYRLSHEAPFPAPMLDGARAVQFLRTKAADWQIDPDRIAATGSSAGAGIALWLGFHEDLAEPASPDVVARQSSRVKVIGVVGAQTTYDPRAIKALVGGRAHEHPALPPFFGVSAGEENSPRALAVYEAASPLNYVTPDDPPVFLYYTEPKGPLPPNSEPGQGIHHPRFGQALRDRLDPLGIACVLRHQDDYPGPSPRDAREAMFREMVDFLAARLGSSSGASLTVPAGR